MSSIYETRLKLLNMETLEKRRNSFDVMFVYIYIYEYGIRGNVPNWFISWLVMRQQRTMFGDEVSEPAAIDIGIPQGVPIILLPIQLVQ